MSLIRRGAWAAGAPTRLILVFLIRAYRVSLSGVMGGRCRFHPSCSEYAEQAVRSVGAVRGSALAAWRILRCSPLSGGGIDQAPTGSLMYESVILPEGQAKP